MEKDTVILGLDEYNQLRDFRKEIFEGKTYVFYEAYNNSYLNRTAHFITSDEAVESLLAENEILGKKDQEHNEELRRLRDEISNIKTEKNNLIKDLGALKIQKDETCEAYSRVRKMSIWEFIKWR